MSIFHDIRNLIEIQDTNIIFEDDVCVKKGHFKEKPCKYITGKLTYDLTHCKNCGIKNHDNIIYKNGTQTSHITLPVGGVQPTYLCLKKQRFMCKACVRAITAGTPIAEKNCFISKIQMLK